MPPRSFTRPHLLICGRRGEQRRSWPNLHKRFANRRVPLQLSVQRRSGEREGRLYDAEQSTSGRLQTLD